MGATQVNGNLSLAAGTNYAAEGTSGGGDEAIVSGTTSVASGATLTISPDAGANTGNTAYMVLNSPPI